MVLDCDYSPIAPIHDYLRYLENKDKSPNTIKAYARNLKLYWEFLYEHRIDWTEITILKLSEFIHWLRISSTKIIDILQPNSSCRTERTINHILKTVRLFYDFQSRLGVVDSLDVYETRRINKAKLKYKPLLHHAQSGTIKTNILKLKEPKLFPGCLHKDEVLKLIEGCTNFRDKFLICLLHETGMRIGEACLTQTLGYSI